MSLSELSVLAYQAASTWGWIVLIGFSLVLAVGLGLFLAQVNTKTGCISGAVLVIGSILLGFIWVPMGANAAADWATTDGIKQAQEERVRSYEMLFGYWSSYSYEVHTCSYSSWSASDTGCFYVYEDSDTTCTGSGDDRTCTTDYDYYPLFTEEYSASAHLDVYEGGDIDFGRIAPKDESKRWCEAGFFGCHVYDIPYGMIVVYDTDPLARDFYRIKSAIDSGELLPGAVPHQYKNYFAGNPSSLQITASGLPTEERIADFEAAGVLASIAPLSGSYSLDYTPVHFSGSLATGMSQPSKKVWEHQARQISGNAGPHLEAYMFINFAKESDLPGTVDEWANTQKGYLMNAELFDKWRLPKNTMGLVCAVNEDMTLITRCAFFQGMFTGNGNVQQEVAAIKDLPFNATDFFGSVTGKIVTDSEGKATVESSRAGGFFDLIYDQTRGFKRQEMGPNDYQMYSVEPTPEQLQQIIADAGGRGGLHGFFAPLIVGFLLFVAAFFISRFN